jgi:nitrate reductase assembly molybdenum cofactor insertion protein NarJ
MHEDIEALERRAIAFFLASRLTAWPDDETWRSARALAEGLHDGDADEKRLAALVDGLADEGREDEYVALFEHGAARVPIHETEYGRMRGLSKGNELADIAGFYTAFGLDRADSSAARQMHDHLAVELEFYGVLLAKQAALAERGLTEGVEVVADARKKFLGDHLGRLAPAVAGQPAVAQSAAWGPVFDACSRLVLDECRRVGVTPAPLDFVAGAAEPEEVCCETAALPPSSP